MDPSLGIAGLADVQNAGPPKELKTFDTTIELGQTEYTTKCFGEVGTGVKAQGNRAAAACSQKAFLCKRRSELRCEGGGGRAEPRSLLLPGPHWQPVRESLRSGLRVACPVAARSHGRPKLGQKGKVPSSVTCGGLSFPGTVGVITHAGILRHSIIVPLRYSAPAGVVYPFGYFGELLCKMRKACSSHEIGMRIHAVITHTHLSHLTNMCPALSLGWVPCIGLWAPGEQERCHTTPGTHNSHAVNTC